MNEALSLSDLCENISADMYLLQGIAKKSFELENGVIRANNISALTRLLEHKNSKYSYSEEQRESDQGWIISKNGDLRPLLSRVAKARADIENKEYSKSKYKTSSFYFAPSDLENQNEFIITNLNYFELSTIKKTSETPGNSLRNQILRKKMENPVNDDFSRLRQYELEGVTYSRNEKKIEAYLKAINNIFQSKSKLAEKEWTSAFKAATQVKVWEILNNLIFNDLNLPSNSIEFHKMALKSLKMVESEFNSVLPFNYESIVYYLSSNYLRKVPGKYIKEGIFGPIWSIAYVLYMAGRKKEFYRYLNNQNLRDAFEAVDVSIENGKPLTAGKGFEENEDIFYNQLLYALKGDPKFADEILCSPHSLDLAWIFLRNVGIFEDGKSKFLELRLAMCDSYKNQHLDETKVKNLIYLLCFDKLVEFGPNEMMDQYDFLHFLIVLYHSPTFKNVCHTSDINIERKLTERLVELIKKLLEEGKKESLYYISLIPFSFLANEVSSLIVNLRFADRMNWKEVQKYMPPEVYNDLVCLTCKKYASTLHEYLYAAERSEELLNNQEQSIEFISEMFIKIILESRLKEGGFGRADSLIKNIFKKDNRLIAEYGPLFEFFQEYRNLVEVLDERNEEKIYNFIKQCKHILISEQLRVSTASTIDKLISKNGFDCYILYMKDIVKAYEICLTKMGRIEDLQEIQRLTLSAVVGLMNSTSYKQFANRENTQELISILQEGLYRYK